jgi:cytochrome P450
MKRTRAPGPGEAAIAQSEAESVDVVDVDYDYLLQSHHDFDAYVARLSALRDQGSAVWVRSAGKPALLFTTYELVDAAFRDEATFPSAAYLDKRARAVQGRNLLTMTGDEHRRKRATVSPAFRARLMPGLIEPLLEPVANELIDRFEDRGEADLVAEFTKIYPFRVIVQLLGLPSAAEDDIRRWALGMMDLAQFDDALACSREFVEFVRPMVHKRRSDPADDLISKLATEEVDGERLTDDEIFDFLRHLFPAGADTTYLGLGSTVFALLTHPEQLERVKADPAEECRWAAEEGLRWAPPVALQPRANPHDVVWHDIAIPAGASLLFGITPANRDPAVFADPDRFDIGRRPAGILSFGLGTHFCLGAPLARAEMDVALRVLLQRLPRLRLVDGADAGIVGTIGSILQGPNRLPVRFD